MAYFKDQKRNPAKKRIRETIRPELDIQGIVRRNEQFLETLFALRPHLLKDDESLQLVDKIIGGLEKIPRNVMSSENHDKDMASSIARLVNNIQSNVELKSYVEALKKMGGELILSRTKPRSMKEVLARNYLGLQPQDVRDKGLLKSFGDDATQNLRAIFAGKGKEDTFKRSLEDQKSIQAIAKKREKRQEEETKKNEAEEKKREQDHEEAIKEDREREKQKERKRDMESVQEEAFDEEKKREDAIKQGIPFITDTIAEKNAIHAQSIEKENEIEEATLRARENQAKNDERRKENQNEEEQKEKDEIESQSDDTVTSEILEEVKAIHEILEKGGGVGGGEGTGRAKGKKRSIDDIGEASADREETIRGMMKAIPGFKREDAEKAYDKGVIQREEEEDKREAELEAHAEDRERSMRRGKEERIQQEREQAHVEELANAHAEALDIDENNKGRVHSTAIAQARATETEKYRSMDKEQAHGEANAWEVQRRSGRIEDPELSHDVAKTMEAKREAKIAEKTKAHSEALKINEGRKLDKGSAEAQAHLMERWRNLPKDVAHQEALAQESKLNPSAPVTASIEEPKAPEMPEGETPPTSGGKGFLGRAWRGAAGIAGKAAGIGSLGSGLATAGVAGGGLYAGWKIGKWANKNLGLQSEGEKLNEIESERAQKVLGDAEGVAHQRGYSSFADMQSANRNKMQRKQTGGAISIEKGGIDERITEKPEHAAPSQPIIYAPSAPAAPQQQRQERLSVFIRPVHPSFMRFQEKRMSRILFPQNTI